MGIALALFAAKSKSRLTAENKKGRYNATMNAHAIHELKLRIWQQPAKTRNEYLSDLEAALLLVEHAQDEAVNAIEKRLVAAEARAARSKQRKDVESKKAEAKLLKDIGP